MALGSNKEEYRISEIPNKINDKLLRALINATYDFLAK